MSPFQALIHPAKTPTDPPGVMNVKTSLDETELENIVRNP